MNCNCITYIKNQLLDVKFGPKEKTVISARLQTGAIMRIGNSMELVTISEFELEIEGQKKKEIQTIVHDFCPFCGTKIKESALVRKHRDMEQQTAS